MKREDKLQITERVALLPRFPVRSSPFAVQLSPGAGRRPIGHRGITLIELLVTMMILLMITAITLPVIAPNLASRRVREAARAIDVYLGVARNRAIETGRPTGVVFGPVPLFNSNGAVQMNNTNPPFLPACNTLYQVEIPPPYCGDTMTAVARWSSGTGSGPWNWTMGDMGSASSGGSSSGTAASNSFSSGSSFTVSNAHVNDLIRFNHQGPFYQINTVSGSTIQAKLMAQTSSGGYMAPPWTSNTPVPYEIFPQPVKTSASPLQLPAGAIVDLEYSGVDTTSITSNGTYNTYPYWFGTVMYPWGVVIVFSPSGAVDAMYYPQQTVGYVTGLKLSPVAPAVPIRPTTTIYLMVGKWERLDRSYTTTWNGTYGAAAMNTWASDGLYNWQDPDNFWVTLNPLTGFVATKENATYAFFNSANAWWQATSTTLYFGSNGSLSRAAGTTKVPTMNGAVASRWFARQAQQTAGR